MWERFDSNELKVSLLDLQSSPSLQRRRTPNIQTELKCCLFVLCWINIFILSSLLHVCNVRPLGLEPRTPTLSNDK